MEYVEAKHIVNRCKSTEWFGTDYTMNIYRGCCHGCIYCDSRSSCYKVEDFDTVRAKKDALKIIRDDLRRKVKKGVIGTGAMSDPYNPFEKELCLTRNALELVNSFEFGIAIATKGTLITRDIDVLQDIQKNSPVICKVTVTTADDALAEVVEPFAPPPSERFESIAALADAGLFAGVLLMPVLPFVEDTQENLRRIVQRAAQCGAGFIYPGLGVTMREGQREYFLDKLEEHFPGTKEKYIRRYGNRYSCAVPNVKRLWRVFEEECQKHGILYEMKAIVQKYQQPKRKSQLTLFDEIN